MPARGEPYAEPYAEIRKVSARERLERLPLEWALEDEHRAMAAQINRSAGATLRASEEARAVELGRRQSEAAAWRSGEPVGAACVLALALLAWCVCRRRRRIRMVPSAAELDVADKRRHAAEEEGTTADASGAAPAPRRGAPVIPRSVNVLLRRAFRQLRALVLLVASPCPRLALALRSWLGTDPKRRDSSFTAPPPACLVVGSSAADDAAIRSTTRSVAPSEHGHGAPRHADASAIEAPDASPSLFGSTSDPPTVLSRAQLAQLARALPARLAIRDWSLAFSTDQHGCSLNTFFARAGRCGASMLLVLDCGGHIFGAFVSQPWHRSTGFFGTGESFLVKVHPHFAVYRWTRRNSLFALAGSDHIAMGGGGAGFGLWLDGSFENGSSSCCDTFGNEPLASTSEFRCVRVELWTFQ